MRTETVRERQMNRLSPRLYLVSGKIASGKSTLMRKLAAQSQTVLISEDFWLSGLYADEMTSIEDYIKYSSRLRDVMGEHIVTLLQNDVSVALDFPANTLRLRNWMRSLFETAAVEHELHFLHIADDICKRRLKQRNREGAHAFAPTDEQFDQMTRLFEPPTRTEGFNLTLHS